MYYDHFFNQIGNYHFFYEVHLHVGGTDEDKYHEDLVDRQGSWVAKHQKSVEEKLSAKVLNDVLNDSRGKALWEPLFNELKIQLALYKKRTKKNEKEATKKAINKIYPNAGLKVTRILRLEEVLLKLNLI